MPTITMARVSQRSTLHSPITPLELVHVESNKETNANWANDGVQKNRPDASVETFITNVRSFVMSDFNYQEPNLTACYHSRS